MDEQPGKTPRPIVSEDLSASANRVDPLVAEMTQEIREPASEITPVSNGIYIPSSQPDRLRRIGPLVTASKTMRSWWATPINVPSSSMLTRVKFLWRSEPMPLVIQQV